MGEISHMFSPVPSGLLAVRLPSGPPVVRKTTDEMEPAMKASSGRLPTMWGTISFGTGSGSRWRV